MLQRTSELARSWWVAAGFVSVAAAAAPQAPPRAIAPKTNEPAAAAQQQDRKPLPVDRDAEQRGIRRRAVTELDPVRPGREDRARPLRRIPPERLRVEHGAEERRLACSGHERLGT